MSLNDSERLELARIEIDNLRKMLEDAKAETAELRRQRDDARDARDAALKRELILDRALYKVMTTAHTCENGYSGGPDCPGCKAIIDLGDFRPAVPMCKPDPLEDIMPPVEGRKP